MWIAAAFYPNPVVVRLSDFKSNEYANLLGGHPFEPKEENPMIGWRGASRYAVKDMVRMVIAKAKKNNRKIGICGQAPSDYPEFAQFLVELGIESMSLNPDSVMKTLLMVAEVEKQQV